MTSKELLAVVGFGSNDRLLRALNRLIENGKVIRERHRVIWTRTRQGGPHFEYRYHRPTRRERAAHP